MKMIFKNKEEYNIFKNAMEKRLGDAVGFSCAIWGESREEFDFKVRFNTEDIRWMICHIEFEDEIKSIDASLISGKLGYFAKLNENIAQSGHQYSFIEQRISNLKEEAKLLDAKIAKARNENNYGTYKNLINAYSEILKLIDRYDWQLMHSEYYTEGKKQVAVWEQNGEGSIRNHKVWDVVSDTINIQGTVTAKDVIGQLKSTLNKDGFNKF